MRMRGAPYVFAMFLGVWCGGGSGLSRESDTRVDPEELRLFLQKGYASAKSVLEDVRIEYETEQVPVNSIPLSPAVIERFKIKNPSDVSDTFNSVQEYIQRRGEERCVFLHVGTSSPKEDVSYRAGLIGTENSPRFRVFDGQHVLDYYPTIRDGISQVGRATLDASKTGLFESAGPMTEYAPVKFFGYYPGLMLDDVFSSPQVTIETKPEKVGDLLTYKISAPIEKYEAKYDIVYWVAPERCCLPVKIEVERNGVLMRHLEAKEFIELQDGRWAIKSIVQRNFVTREGEKGPIENVNLIYTIRSLELHPDIDEDKVFDTSPESLPAGVDIIDKVSGLRYFAGEGPVSDRRVADVIKKSLESINEISTEEIVGNEVDDANNRLFSDTGILGSAGEQAHRSSHGRMSIRAVALAGIGVLVVSLAVTACFRKLRRVDRAGKES
jgi:hypothetical protein